MRTKKTERYYIILFFIMGVLVFSPMSSIISIDIMHLPLALPEVFFVPFLFLLKDKFKSVHIKGRVLFNVILTVSFLLLFALLAGEFSLFAILSNARAWFYTFLFLGMFMIDNDITYDDILYLAFGSIVGWALACYFNINKFLSVGDYNIFITYGLMMSLPLFYSITLFKNKKLLFLIGFALTVFIMLFCGTRRVILVSIISIIISIILQSIHRKKALLMYALIGVGLFVVISAMMPTIEEYIKEYSPHLHYRLFTRTENLAEEGLNDEGDAARLNFIASTYDEMDKSCIPNGFISMQTNVDDVGHYNDYPLTMLFWIFSWPVTFIILFYFLVLFFKNMAIFYRKKHIGTYVSVVSLFVMFILLFLDGSFIVYAYATPITGAILGVAIRNAKL